ncbi:MAG: right-handed parallel beta-helix repeat-containing protein [archaeon]
MKKRVKIFIFILIVLVLGVLGIIIKGLNTHGQIEPFMPTIITEPYTDIYLPVSSYPIDVDGNGLVDYLVVEFETNLSNEENYDISGILLGENEDYISSSGKIVDFSNKRIIQLNFSGLGIRSKEMGGKFRFGNVYVIGDNTRLNIQNKTYFTQNYNKNDFEYQSHLLECGKIVLPNLVYILDNNLNTSGDCFNVQTGNIILNLNEHIISGDGSGIGIYESYQSNVSIKNGRISNFSKGMEIRHSNNNIITNLFIGSNKGDGINNGQGIDFLLSNYNLISNNTFDNNEGDAINLDGSSSNNISNNNFTSGFRAGVYLLGSNNNTIKENFIMNSQYIGIYLNQASGNQITNNTISLTKFWGIYVEKSSVDQNIISNNTLSKNGRKGIYFEEIT